MDEEKIQEPIKNAIKFSWLRIVKVVLAIVILGALVGGLWFALSSRPVKIAWADWVLNRHEHYLPCYSLPFLEQAQKALSNHQDVVQKLLAEGAKSIQPVENKCFSSDGGMYFVKGDILITYQTRAQKDDIEKTIGDNFFGIPYRGEPVR